MRLDNIKIAGFKSFPERAELAFDDGVTAIVGPNGCGKSNVIDAITWVLGEQSARSLRGERMEDVIFSGSDARRPTAAAEVSIQLSKVTAALHDVGPGLEIQTNIPTENLRDRNKIGSESTNEIESAGQSSLDAPGISGAPGTDASDILSEFDEIDRPVVTRDVEVARRLYRSGESEYLIDGQVCRLRDIQDLLMDSGVGVKAYAVIEQGRIGQILGARPAERRQLLEEAAGITKYKSRRRSAELKLEAAQQNLTRVDDIVFEVEKQRIALKRQAAKARRYRRLREELRRWEMVSFVRRSEALAADVKMTESLLSKAVVQEQSTAASLSGFETDQARLRLELVESDQAVTAIRDQAHQSELELERRQQKLDFDRQQVVELEVAQSGGSEELRSLTAKSGPISNELRLQVDARDSCVQERDFSAEMLAQVEQDFEDVQLSIESHESAVEAARSEIYAAANAVSALQNVVENSSLASSRISESLLKLEAEAAEIQTDVQRNMENRVRADKEVMRLRERIESVKSICLKRESELGHSKIDIEHRIEDLQKREHELASRRARVQSLEELEAGRADYEEAARVVLGSVGAITHSGSVVDHLNVEQEFEVAVEASLGELLQYVVVGSRHDALAGIELASNSGAGRCGFLINGDADDSSTFETSPHPALRSLFSVIRVSGSGESVVGRLLKRRWLAPSMEVATEAALLTNDPIVTSDGVVVRGSELLHGGLKQDARGLLAAKREIRESRVRIANDVETIDELSRELVTKKEHVARELNEVGKLKSEQHEAEKELVSSRMQAQQSEEEHVRLNEKLELVQTESRQASEERDSLERKEKEARESIDNLKIEKQSADQKFMDAQGHLLEARESVNTLRKNVADAKATHAALLERAAALTADVRRLEEQQDDFRLRIRTREKENERVTSERERLLEEVKLSEVQCKSDAESFEGFRQKIVLLDKKAGQLQANISLQGENVLAARSQLDQAKSDVSQCEIERARAMADLSHLGESCSETIQMTLESAIREVARLEAQGALVPDQSLLRNTVVPAAESSEESDNQNFENETEVHQDDEAESGSNQVVTDTDGLVNQLRSKIDRVGPVNMMAIDQFDELEERHEFLTVQRQDLIDSIAATDEAIKRIDKTTRERFQEAFTAVNEHFQFTFETLFGGGRAGLVLLDDTDVLESGIDIIAQPPGKRLQNIQLLSGGEKALTAMALMFAIFKYKPSPFCLLDEIDAPLDDANIARFVDMLRGLQERTQFVLVTHNRKTMEIADRLYGVTMEEPGVSKLISVDMH
jgi:chromosome segregation protein